MIPLFNKPFTNGPSHASDGMIFIRASSAARPSSKDMKYKVERMRFVTRHYVRAHPDKIFLFGDNLERRGLGGQAASMRGEPNAIGIPTKKSPNYSEGAFFTDEEFPENRAAIDRALAQINSVASDSSRVIVIPSCGLGTGRAQLDRRAPRTFAYLQNRLAELSEAF